MSDPRNKAELLEKMQTGYSSFEALLVPLSAAQMSTPGVNGEWAVKDVLVHLTYWQVRVSLRLEAQARHEKLQLEPIDSDEQMNALNDATFEANRARSLNDVLADFRAAVKRLYGHVASTDELDLFEAGRLDWLEGDVLWHNIAGNTYEHYEEHASMIEQWLSSQRA